MFLNKNYFLIVNIQFYNGNILDIFQVIILTIQTYSNYEANVYTFNFKSGV